jgi:hypothetical protein
MPLVPLSRTQQPGSGIWRYLPVVSSWAVCIAGFSRAEPQAGSAYYPATIPPLAVSCPHTPGGPQEGPGPASEEWTLHSAGPDGTALTGSPWSHPAAGPCDSKHTLTTWSIGKPALHRSKVICIAVACTLEVTCSPCRLASLGTPPSINRSHLPSSIAPLRAMLWRLQCCHPVP